jgi:hypothetical protein
MTVGSQNSRLEVVVIIRQGHGKYISAANRYSYSDRRYSVFYVGIARQGQGKHISTERNQQATIQKLLETVFFVRFAPRLYNKNQQQNISSGITCCTNLHQQETSAYLV